MTSNKYLLNVLFEPNLIKTITTYPYHFLRKCIALHFGSCGGFAIRLYSAADYFHSTHQQTEGKMVQDAERYYQQH